MLVEPKLDPPEARWPAIVAVLAVGGLYLALPPGVVVGPRWMMPAIISALLIPGVVSYRRENHAMNSLFGNLLASVLTLFMVWSLVLLVGALPSHKEQPTLLLRSAVCLWLTNVLVFAVWYWRIDAGGPHARDVRAGHASGSFLFPQMTLKDEDADANSEWMAWSPEFVDYLFLAFNTSTAFSPTDVPVLSRWAKILMMCQSCISLTIVAILAGRAVNIL